MRTVSASVEEELYAPGTVLEVRDETWLVERAERASDGWFVEVQGLSELVRGTRATFSSAIDDVVPLDPARATVRVDPSARFSQSRLWLKAAERKGAIPLADPSLTVAVQGLADVLPYQVAAVRQALDPENLRPRILLADAVGLGKTVEIGMILSELVRRGQGERILIVTPRHVLEQMQFEMWTRFALPFVRLDSLGIQRIRRQLPANRNPFAYFRRVIVSIDTLKSDRYHAHLERQHWDAIVIDESHNVTNDATQNNRLARLLSARADALILASATPHNGQARSFAELIRMLEPSAVTPEGELIEDELRRLIVRRHRHSPEVAGVVGADWAERRPPRNVLVPASPIEDEIAAELDRTWLHPPPQPRLAVGQRSALFPWTLAKAYLSSSAALAATVRTRLCKTTDPREQEALERVRELAERARATGSSKYDALLRELTRIGVSPGGRPRVVIFAERIDTLDWLADRLIGDRGFSESEVQVLHGGMTDIDQQAIVESFKQESSPIRVLVTGDVASEGVNLHLQCHELIHYDIPWSLIRIEQRNGRVDRYGQRHKPQITALLLTPTTVGFGGDLRVLARLIDKEHEAHRALGDSASLMGKYDVEAEESAIRSVLAGERDLEDVVDEVEHVRAGGGLAGLLARLTAPIASAGDPAVTIDGEDRAGEATMFLRDALRVVFETPAADPRAGGVQWREHPEHALVELTPTEDLRQRLDVLPQSYLRERRVGECLRLATTGARGRQALLDARAAESSSLWPRGHYLAPLHPALDWAADRVLAVLGRNEVFAVTGPGSEPPALLLRGALTNARGQTVAAHYVVVRYPDPSDRRFALPEPVATLDAALALLGVDGERPNVGALDGAGDLDAYIAPGVDAARTVLDGLFAEATADVQRRVERWLHRLDAWEHDAEALVQRHELRDRRAVVLAENDLAEAMRPSQRLVLPMLLVIPEPAKN